MYDWLTQPVLDPTNSGRVTMDNLMKLVIAALEWSYEAKATDVQVELLERAAELLVLRYDTFGIIDGEGPSVEMEQASGTERTIVSELSARHVAPSNEEQKSLSPPTEQETQTRSRKKTEASPAASDKCPFSGDVQISLQRFEESGVARVECPGCGRTWTLSSSSGVLRFRSHDKCKTNTPNTGRRWAKGEEETDWDVVRD